jgi:hypothetical protein
MRRAINLITFHISSVRSIIKIGSTYQALSDKLALPT